MDLFNSLPLKKQEYMNRLFRNCTEEVKYYMSVIDVEADQTFIKAGEECKYIYIILSGKVTGVEWPMHEKSYFFKDFGPGDFFGEIECFAGLPRYRISILSSTKCRLLAIPSIYYMEWMHMDVDALCTVHENTGKYQPPRSANCGSQEISVYGRKRPINGSSSP